MGQTNSNCKQIGIIREFEPNRAGWHEKEHSHYTTGSWQLSLAFVFFFVCLTANLRCIIDNFFLNEALAMVEANDF